MENIGIILVIVVLGVCLFPVVWNMAGTIIDAWVDIIDDIKYGRNRPY